MIHAIFANRRALMSNVMQIFIWKLNAIPTILPLLLFINNLLMNIKFVSFLELNCSYFSSHFFNMGSRTLLPFIP